MKRAIFLIILLALVLLVALLYRVQEVRSASHGPAGGTGVIEGVDVNITSRISTRITKIHVREGDMVKEGQLLVELDCAEQEATLAEEKARLLVAQASEQAAHSPTPT
jgi:multidrug efflux pump subunit AcrA (membrane-fusion protein)